MNIIKYIMLLILWISMSLIGKIIAKKYSYRVEELEEMKNALNIFKNKIKFTYSPIGEIFEEISQNTSIKNIDELKENISEIENLRSHIINGKIVLKESNKKNNVKEKRRLL